MVAGLDTSGSGGSPVSEWPFAEHISDDGQCKVELSGVGGTCRRGGCMWEDMLGM